MNGAGLLDLFTSKPKETLVTNMVGQPIIAAPMPTVVPAAPIMVLIGTKSKTHESGLTTNEPVYAKQAWAGGKKKNIRKIDDKKKKKEKQK